MRKSDVVAHFGSQSATARALTEAGFPITARGVCKWPDPIPLDRAVQVERVTHRKLRADLGLYRQ